MTTGDSILVNITEPMFGIQIGKHPLRTHAIGECANNWCCIHNPSPHHMREWEQNWRADRYMMERVCPHGIGHPDPDDLKVLNEDGAGIHGCCGCCVSPDTGAQSTNDIKEN